MTEGPIPDNSRFILPVTIKGGQSDTYYIYYDNKAAWPLGAVLEEERYGKKDGKEPDFPKEDKLHAEIKATQTIVINEKGRNEEWPADPKWDIRVPVKVFNFGRTNQRFYLFM